MPMDRIGVFAAGVLITASFAAASDAPPTALQSAELQCIPVQTWWPDSSTGRADLEPPRLAVLAADLRPKDTIVLLDDRVVGRSKYLNGDRGFLYLEPGRYTLELRLDGYRPEVFAVDARPGCRFDLRHRMVRDRSVDEEGFEGLGKGKPTQWTWTAGSVPEAAASPPQQRGPDPGLRPDLSAPGRAPSAPAAELGSLRLRVAPQNASVYLNGAFVATARELGLMVAPLAVPAGSHTLEVRAPGYATRTQDVAITAGEVSELIVELDRGPS